MKYQIIEGDALEKLQELPDQSVHCCVTSPPYYGLRDYGLDGQIGLEETPEQYIEQLVGVFREVRRVLRDDGTAWLNLGDSYSGGQTGRNDKNTGGGLYQGQQNGWTGEETKQRHVPTGLKPKDLLMIPARVALALQADGWYLRSDIIWHKPNPMPESVTDRPTSAHEHIFLLSKKERYYYDADAIREPHQEASIERDKAGWKAAFKGRHTQPGEKRPHSTDTNGFLNPNGRNRRNVWTVTTKPLKQAHFATFPPKLIQPCILAGCPKGGTVLDPFAGAGTTLLVADGLGRNSIGIELSPEYIKIAQRRIQDSMPLMHGLD